VNRYSDMKRFLLGYEGVEFPSSRRPRQSGFGAEFIPPSLSTRLSSFRVRSTMHSFNPSPGGQKSSRPPHNPDVRL
jgi:hypothetical protein